MPINLDQQIRVNRIKNYLSLAFHDPNKAKNFDQAIKLADILIDFNSATVYIKKINSVLKLDQKDADHTLSVLDLVGPVKDIVLDIFTHVEQIKDTMSKSNRDFIKKNADIFALVCVISLFLKIDQEEILKPDNFVALLQAIMRLSEIKLDMDVKKSWKNLLGLL